MPDKLFPDLSYFDSTTRAIVLDCTTNARQLLLHDELPAYDTD